MTRAVEKIQIAGKTYSRFIAHPKVVRDGTVRCFLCGQIDEPVYHTLSCREAVERQDRTQ